MDTFLNQHGLLAAFVFLLIEEAGVPVPVPGDFLMLLLGVQARTGQVTLWQAILAMEAATILGATLLYAIARWGGRALVYRYGRFMRLTPEKLDSAERWIARHGWQAVFLGRLLPGLRIVTAVACGVFEVPLRVYLPAMALGGLLYIVVYTLLGYFFGPPVLAFLERLHLPLGLLGSLIPLLLLSVWIVRSRQGIRPRVETGRWELNHRFQLRAGAVAGFVATIGSTLLMNVLLNLAGNLAFQAPGTIVEQTASRLAYGLARDLQPALLFVAVPAYLAVGILWGALYAVWAEPRLHRLPDWVEGMVFALVPLAFSSLVAMPLLGLGFFGVGATGAVAAVGETVRHAAYGSLLSLTYPILLTRRRVYVRPHSPEDLPARAAAPSVVEGV